MDFTPFPLYLLTDPLLSNARPLDSVVEDALRAGARMIQYRAKGIGIRDAFLEAGKLRTVTRAYGALFLINDHVDLALAVGADGVHLGQEDLPLVVARELLGKGRIIGVSTHNPEEARSAEQEGADYIGLGPIFASSTKISDRAPVGLEGLKRVREVVNLPIYGIGGMTEERIPGVIGSGADGVAAISGLAAETAETVAKWLLKLESARSGRARDFMSQS